MKRHVHTLLGLFVGMTLVTGVIAPGSARADNQQDRVSAGSDYASSRGTTIGLAMLDRVTGRYRDNGAVAHRRIESASVMKVFIAENLLHRRDLGEISLAQGDLDDMVRMLRSSDNPPANRFWDTFGANGIVRDVIARYGLTETGLTSNIRYWGNTLITAHDMVVFYQRLLDGAGGLSAGSRDFIVDQLRQSTPWGADGAWQFFGLHDGLPREGTIGQKQGWMCCVNGGIYRHSTGFVGFDARYIVVALSKEPSTLGAAHIEGSLTDAVQHMFPEGFIPRKQEVVAEAWYRSGGAGGPLGLPDTGERRTDDGRPVSGPGRDVDHAAHSDDWSDPVSLRRAVLTLCLVAVTAGCSEPRPGRTPEATPASASASGPSLPLAAGADVVRAVHRLPDGPADGTIVVSYNGLGELRGDLHGECAHEGNATTITGSSSTARLIISFDGTGAHLELTDVGLAQSSQLAAGSYQVDPPRLVVNTQLLGGGALAGTLSLDVVCDGAAG